MVELPPWLPDSVITHMLFRFGQVFCSQLAKLLGKDDVNANSFSMTNADLRADIEELEIERAYLTSIQPPPRRGRSHQSNPSISSMYSEASSLTNASDSGNSSADGHDTLKVVLNHDDASSPPEALDSENVLADDPVYGS